MNRIGQLSLSLWFFAVTSLGLVVVDAGPASAAEASAQARAWLAASRSDVQATDVREHVAHLPFTGKEIHSLKVRDTAHLANGKPSAVKAVFDESGVPLPDGGNALQAAEDQTQWQARGGIQEALWQHLQQVGPDEKIPVALWLRESEPPSLPRSEAANSVAVESDRQAREQAHDVAKTAFLLDASQHINTPFRDRVGAPVVTADLTAAEIRAIAWLPRLGWIDWQRPYAPQANRYSWARTSRGDYSLTGEYGAVPMCIIEPRMWQNFTSCDENSVALMDLYATADGYRDNDLGKHARAVLGAIDNNAASPIPQGFAHQAKIYFANYDLHYSIPEAAYWCSQDQSGQSLGKAQVWNFSAQCNDTLCPMLMDYWVKHSPFPLITIPSGNNGNPSTRATVLNLAWNSLTVGGSDDIDSSTDMSTDRNNDTADTGACDLNPTVFGRTDWELPNVVAPSHEQLSDGQTDGYLAGTSLSSAQVAGIAAQVYQKNTALNSWPEAVRAIIIASADRDVDNGRLSMTDAIDDRDGAGEVDGQLAVELAASTNHVPYDNTATWRGISYGTLCDTSNTSCGSSAQVGALSTWSHVYKIKWDPAVTGNPSLAYPRTRVVFTWDAHATCGNVANGSASCNTGTDHNLDADIDLHIYDPNNNQVGMSNTFRSNWEFAEFVPTAGVEYTVTIFVYGWFDTSTYYGIAWNTATYPAN